MSIKLTLESIEKVVGKELIEDINKSEIGLHKLNTNTVLDPQEIQIALQIVPRYVLSYLYHQLKWLQPNDTFKLELPFVCGCVLQGQKHSSDNYSAQVIKDAKVVAHISYRSLPGVGLILMSALELYDTSMIEQISPAVPEVKEEVSHIEKLQDLIDERLALQGLIANVVDKRISERDAIKEMIRERINKELLTPHVEPQHQPESPMKSKLKEFLENKEKKRQEYLQKDIELGKSEICCPDCQSTLYDGKNINLCICYGDSFGSEIKVTKNDKNEIKLKFPKGLDADNIQMLLDSLKKR